MDDLEERRKLRQKALGFLNDNAIEYEIIEHPPLFTIEEALKFWVKIDDCTHCKNIFLRNHKGNRHYLVTMECHKNLDIHALEHKVKEGKLSFASEERMVRCLGLHPGSVSPLGLINDMLPLTGDVKQKELFDNGHRVKYFIDADLKLVSKASFHPCENSASVILKQENFRKLLEIWGGDYQWLEI